MYNITDTKRNISCSKKLNNFLGLINDDTNNHLIGKFIVLHP